MTTPPLLDAPDLTAATIRRFEELHGEEPTRVAFAPGRINLIGEHVDYVAGRCLPVALRNGTWVAARERDDDRVVATSGPGERWEGARTDLARARTENSWARYVLAALEASKMRGGVTVHVESSLPLASGLSSSAALICAVLRAVDDRGNVELVEAAIEAETVHVQAPTGGMDQSAALLASENHALRLDFAGGRPVALPWHPELVGLEVLVIDTRVRHSNDDGAFARIRAVSEAALGLAPAPEGVQAEQVARHHNHVTSELARVDAVVDAVVRGDWRTIGSALDASHASLRDALHVSCEELDVAVEAARNAGALGARMTGGGFGGCAIALIPSELREQVMQAVLNAFAEHGHVQPRFLAGTAAGPATRIR